MPPSFVGGETGGIAENGNEVRELTAEDGDVANVDVANRGDDDYDDDDDAELSIEIDDTAAKMLTNVRQMHKAEVIEDLIDGITVNCFDQCIFPISHRLTNSDKACIDVCMERFTTAQNIVVNMLQKS